MNTWCAIWKYPFPDSFRTENNGPNLNDIKSVILALIYQRKGDQHEAMIDVQVFVKKTSKVPLISAETQSTA